jgi:hypothetical protein
MFTYTLTILPVTHRVVSQEQFIQIIQSLLEMETPLQKTPQFIFQRSKEAAYQNALILQKYNFNIDAAIMAQEGSQVHYGSEFKHPSHLQELLEHHPHWTQLIKILTDGATFPIIPLDNKDRQKDLIFHKEHGNHKSASKHLDKLDSTTRNIS